MCKGIVAGSDYRSRLLGCQATVEAATRRRYISHIVQWPLSYKRSKHNRNIIIGLETDSLSLEHTFVARCTDRNPSGTIHEIEARIAPVPVASLRTTPGFSSVQG